MLLGWQEVVPSDHQKEDLKGSKVSINTARNIIHSCKIQVEGDQD
jgi:hypothetical protein